jgi:hypothetical protein
MEAVFWESIALSPYERESAAAFMSVFPKRMKPLLSCMFSGRGVKRKK